MNEIRSFHQIFLQTKSLGRTLFKRRTIHLCLSSLSIVQNDNINNAITLPYRQIKEVRIVRRKDKKRRKFREKKYEFVCQMLSHKEYGFMTESRLDRMVFIASLNYLIKRWKIRTMLKLDSHVPRHVSNHIQKYLDQVKYASFGPWLQHLSKIAIETENEFHVLLDSQVRLQNFKKSNHNQDLETNNQQAFVENSILLNSLLISKLKRMLHLIKIRSDELINNAAPNENISLAMYRKYVKESFHQDSEYVKHTLQQSGHLKTILELGVTLRNQMTDQMLKDKCLNIMEMMQHLTEKLNHFKSDYFDLEAAKEKEKGKLIHSDLDIKMKKNHIEMSLVENQLEMLTSEKMMLVDFFAALPTLEELNSNPCLIYQRKYEYLIHNEEMVHTLIENKKSKNVKYLSLFLQQINLELQRPHLVETNIRILLNFLDKEVKKHVINLNSLLKEQEIIESETRKCEKNISTSCTDEEKIFGLRYWELSKSRLEVLKRRLSLQMSLLESLEKNSQQVKYHLNQHISFCEKDLETAMTSVDYSFKNFFQQYYNQTWKYHLHNFHQSFYRSREIQKLQKELKDVKHIQDIKIHPNKNGIVTLQSQDAPLNQEDVQTEKSILLHEMVLKKLASEWTEELTPAANCYSRFVKLVQQQDTEDSLYTLENLQRFIVHTAELLFHQRKSLKGIGIEFEDVSMMIEKQIFSNQPLRELAIKKTEQRDLDEKYFKTCVEKGNFLCSLLMKQSVLSKFFENSDNFVGCIRDKFKDPIQLFTSMSLAHSPTEKLSIITKASKDILSILVEFVNDQSQVSEVVGSDDFLPVCIAVHICSPLNDMKSQISFIETYANEQSLIQEEGYYFSSLMSSFGFVQTYFDDAIGEYGSTPKEIIGLADCSDTETDSINDIPYESSPSEPHAIPVMESL